MTHEEAIQKLKAAYGERFRMDDDIYPSWVENIERFCDVYGLTLEEGIEAYTGSKSENDALPVDVSPVRKYRINEGSALDG